jgi:hypothetical protein
VSATVDLDATVERLDLSGLANQIAQRVGRDGLADWLPRLAATMHLSSRQLMPDPAVASHRGHLPHAGIQLELWHPHAVAVMAGDPQRWVITRAVFESNWSLPWPFGLDAAAARYPAVVKRLLGESVGLSPRDLAAGDLRHSIFLDDGLVVGLTWCPGGLGFERMELVRVGRTQAYGPLVAPTHPAPLRGES